MHQNGSYSAVQKLFYLRQHLDGVATHAIQSLQLTSESCPVAIKIVQDRFGKDDIRNESLIMKLLNLPRIANADSLRSLRHLVDEVMAFVRSLEVLNAHHVGDVLLPVLKGKIPAAWRLQWARRRRQQNTSDQSSELKTFLKFLQVEMECQEESVRVAYSLANKDMDPTIHQSTLSAKHTST